MSSERGRVDAANNNSTAAAAAAAATTTVDCHSHLVSYSSSNSSCVIRSSTSQCEIKVTKKRYLIMVLFALYSMSNAFQWIQYSIVADKISKYYNVSTIAVNWTSIFYMILYAPLVLPGTWILNRKGLRFCVLAGSAGTCLGSWIKCASVDQNGFTVTMIGQAIVAASQIFVLNLPPQIAAVWFGADEVSTATSFGVFGNQIGIALGFLIPPLLLQGSKDPSDIEYGLTLLFYSTAIITSVLFVVKLLLFDDAPPYPPSKAAAYAKVIGDMTPCNGSPDKSSDTEAGTKKKAASNDIHILKSLFTNVNYILILITYGLNVGVFYAISTVLGQLVELSFPGTEVEAGLMGLIIIIAGIFGSVICGIILDKTHKFKETTIFVYIFSLFGTIAFALALKAPFIWPLFPISALLGFFMTGYLPIGFEFAAEVSYPNPEGTSAGLLNAAAQVIKSSSSSLHYYLLAAGKILTNHLIVLLFL